MTSEFMYIQFLQLEFVVTSDKKHINLKKI